MASLSKDQKDLLRLLSSNCHIGTKNLSHKMKPYVESKTNEGVHLINPVETLEKIKLFIANMNGTEILEPLRFA